MPIRIIQPAGKPPGVGEDMLRSAGEGLIEGLSSIPGAIGDLRGLADAGVQKGYEAMGGQGKGPSLMMPAGVKETSTALQGFAKLAGADPRVARLVAALTPGGLMAAPNSADLAAAVRNDKPAYQSKTKSGERVRTLAQFAPAALAPGSAPQKLANVLAPAVASQAAGELTEGKPYESLARTAGAILGGGGAALVGRGGPSNRLLAEGSRGATDQQITAARQLMERAQTQGVRLTMPEALQQVSNGATGLGRLQRVVEGTQGGNERIGPVMAQRPGQVSAAVRRYADAIAPPTNQPSMLGAQAREGADAALTGVRQEINAQAAPSYEALRWQLLGDPIMAPLHQNPAYLETARSVRNHPVLGPPLEGLEDGSPAFVNEVVKQLDTLAENARPGPMNPGGNNQLASAYQQAAGEARRVMEQHVPEWSQARNIVAQGRAQNLEPLQRGPLGAIAATEDVGQQTRALFPRAPQEGAPAETAQALQMLGGSASDAARGLMRQQVMTGFNEAAQDLSTGPNQWGGAGWAAKQFGNPEQAATMRAGAEVATGSAQPLDDLVEILRATGRRQAPGSMTAYNSRDLERLGEAGALGEIGRTGLNPPGAFRRVGQALQNWQTETNAGRLAEAMLASPAEAERILLRARAVVPPGAALDRIEALALQARLSQQPAEAQ
jgi:hypothetical protein